MRNCLVMGAAGYIGSYLVPHLQTLGYRVIAGARRPCRLPEGVECRLADSLKPITLRPALAGIDTVFYLVHAMGAGADFHRLEQQGVKNFAAAARAAISCGYGRNVYKRVVGSDLWLRCHPCSWSSCKGGSRKAGITSQSCKECAESAIPASRARVCAT